MLRYRCFLVLSWLALHAPRRLTYALGSLAFRYVLGEPSPARTVLWSTLFQGIALNLVLAWPMYRLARLLLPQAQHFERVERIQALG